MHTKGGSEIGFGRTVDVSSFSAWKSRVLMTGLEVYLYANYNLTNSI